MSLLEELEQQENKTTMELNFFKFSKILGDRYNASQIKKFWDTIEDPDLDVEEEEAIMYPLLHDSHRNDIIPTKHVYDAWLDANKGQGY